MAEQRTIKCPFCEIGDIVTVYTPPLKITRITRGSAINKSHTTFKDEKYEVVSKECSNCGKSKKEIEKGLKVGKQPSREDVIKRMREAGLDPTKLK